MSKLHVNNLKIIRITPKYNIEKPLLNNYTTQMGNVQYNTPPSMKIMLFEVTNSTYMSNHHKRLD